MAVENPRTIRILKLVLLLCGSRYYNLSELMRRLSISDRTVYRDLETLEQVGFDVDRNDGQYRINPTSGTKAAINTMKDELENLVTDPISLKDELASYAQRGKDHVHINEILDHVKTIWEAINQKRQVILRDYRSSSSGNISTRTVEPFSFSSEHQSVWAFEMKSSMCKQFKITRLNEVEILNSTWQFENNHQLPFTDIFNISGEKPMDEIELELQLNAYNLLLEEFPGAEKYITSSKPYILRVPVAGYEGIGRFVLGLIDSVKVRRSKNFRGYLKEKMKSFN